MDEFKIEKGIPIPERLLKKKIKFPFYKMQIGDSVFFSITENDPINSLKKRVVARASYYAGKCNFKFVSRSEGDGVRIWRIE